MKGAIFEKQILARSRLQGLATIRWLFIWGKGLDLKILSGNPF